MVLSDEAQTCQCVDFCVRKHACKHIRLVLTQLDIADQPAAWREVTCKRACFGNSHLVDCKASNMPAQAHLCSVFHPRMQAVKRKIGEALHAGQ